MANRVTGSNYIRGSPLAEESETQDAILRDGSYSLNHSQIGREGFRSGSGFLNAQRIRPPANYLQRILHVRGRPQE